jgi:hypothetical protein
LRRGYPTAPDSIARLDRGLPRYRCRSAANMLFRETMPRSAVYEA